MGWLVCLSELPNIELLAESDPPDNRIPQDGGTTNLRCIEVDDAHRVRTVEMKLSARVVI